MAATSGLKLYKVYKYVNRQQAAAAAAGVSTRQAVLFPFDYPCCIFFCFFPFLAHLLRPATQVTLCSPYSVGRQADIYIFFD